MDFQLKPEEKAYQQELRDFLDNEVNENVINETESMLGPGPYSKELIRKLGERKLLTPSWPAEYGGRDLNFVCDTIFLDEIIYHRGPFPIDGIELGRVLISVGSSYLKKKFLPGIASGEIDIALGYTEPDSGSDLASLKFSAVENGDEFILNGQKIYNTEVHTCDYHWVLVRTDPNAKPKQNGLSIFIVDLKSPGITIRPLFTTAGLRTNEVFYDNVRVDKKNLVGEKNQGWKASQGALRGGGPGHPAGFRHRFEHLMNYLLHERSDILAENPWILDEMAKYYISIHIGDLLGYRLAVRSDEGVVSPHELTIGSLWSNSARKAFFQTAMQILGQYGQIMCGSKWAQIDGTMLREYLDGPRWTIIHGTQEIQRLLVARGLGLPKQ